jgi:hypothetical protein
MLPPAKSDQGIHPHPHPSPIDRNKSIIWARYLIDSTDWLVFATNVTRVNVTESVLSSPIKLLSLSVLSPGGKVVFETMLKPQEEINNQIIAEHGLEQSIVFNSLPFSEIVIRLNKLFEGRQVLAWDVNATQVLLDEVSTQFAQPQVILSGYSLRPEYARYVGEVDSAGGAYKAQPLARSARGATAECRDLISTLYHMASSSQSSNTAATGNQGWTGEFYKPKLSATDKIKDFLGF